MGIDFNDIVYENVKWMFSGIGIVVLGFFIRKMIVVSESRETGIPIRAPPIANAYIGATIGRRIKN